MLRILGRRASACDGTTRREVLRAGGLSLFGSMTLPRLLQAVAQVPLRLVRPGQVDHSVEPVRWTKPPGHVRHEARCSR